MKLKFIEDIRGSWKLLSIHVAAVWAAIIGAITADPTLLSTVWNNIPDMLRPELPHWAKGMIFGGMMFITIFGARVIKQPVRKLGDQP